MANDETVKAAGINTRLAHSGNDPHAYFGFVNPPVVHASTVLFADARSMADRDQKYTYGTRGTPTSDALAAAINELEGLGRHRDRAVGLAAVVLPLLAYPVGRRPRADRRFGLFPDAQILPTRCSSGWASRWNITTR